MGNTEVIVVCHNPACGNKITKRLGEYNRSQRLGRPHFCSKSCWVKFLRDGDDKQILLVIDGAGWHRSEQVVVPNGIHLLLLPPYSPELQPAERLWTQG